jgi:glycosyltransferase involved in cell wall biosynthesis
MRVLVITGSYPPAKCGVGDYTYCLVEQLSKIDGLSVAVIVQKNLSYEKSNSAVTVFDIVDRWRLLDFFAIRRVVRSWNPDVIHIQYPTQGYGRAILPWCLPALLELLGEKVVQTWHEGFEFLPRPIMSLKALSSGPIVVVRKNYWDLFTGVTKHLNSIKKTIFIGSAPSIYASQKTERELSTLRRKHLGHEQERLIAFFGFIYPNKGVEQIFEIADSARDRILLMGEFDRRRPYCRALEDLSNEPDWSGKVEILGFVLPEAASDLIAASDAIVLPFPDGGGEWNTSILAAKVNGSFVLTTSKTRRGYYDSENVYYARPGDIHELSAALDRYAGTKLNKRSSNYETEWRRVADQHVELYQAYCAK